MLNSENHFKMRLIQENFQNYFSLISNSLIKNPETAYGSSDIQHPIFNGIFHTNAQASELSKIHTEILDFFKNHNLPFCWWVTTLSKPKELEQFLKDTGFSCAQSFSGRCLELKNYEKSIGNANACIANVNIIPVQEAADLDNWMVPFQVSFELSNEVSAKILQILKKLFLQSKKILQHFMAFQNGKLVGSASLFLDKNSAGFYNLGVLPAFRQQGIGTALKRHRLEEVKKNGYQYAVIHSSPLGEDIDKKLGFEEYMRLSAYTQYTGELLLHTISD